MGQNVKNVYFWIFGACWGGNNDNSVVAQYDVLCHQTKLQLRLSEGFYHMTYSDIIHDFGCPMDAYCNKQYQ